MRNKATAPAQATSSMGFILGNISLLRTGSTEQMLERTHKMHNTDQFHVKLGSYSAVQQTLHSVMEPTRPSKSSSEPVPLDTLHIG